MYVLYPCNYQRSHLFSVPLLFFWWQSQSLIWDCTRQTDRRTHLVLVEPLDDLVALVDNGLLVVVADLVLELLVLDGALHVEGVALQAVLGGDAVALLLILRLVLVGVTHHPLDLLLRQATWNRHVKTNGYVRARSIKLAD